MKTKSYKIYTDQENNWIQASEMPGQDQIKIMTRSGGHIYMNSDEWNELMGLHHKLTCNESESEPKLNDIKLPTDQLKKEMEKS